MEILKQISQIQLFKGLNEEELGELAMILVDQEIKRNQPIFSEGEEATGLYIVVTGSVKIYKLSFDGKEQILHILGAGEPFAEVAVFTGSTYPANAITMEKSRVFFIPRQSFMDLITRYPSLAMSMLATLSLRLRQFAGMIESLSLKEVPGRLATHLLLLSDQNKGKAEVELTIAKTQLAAYLGTIPETLSRILSKLVKAGYVESKGAIITILDREGLQELAEGAVKL
ncbi:MAG: Crp/Fnr family transcriptional regulator [Thermodesulfobacteriota bacterium]